MTGPAPGKVRVTDSSCKLICGDRVIELKDAEIYIHLKGYSLARVTHLDIEHPLLDKVVKAGEGGYYRIYNYEDKIRISIEPKILINYQGLTCRVHYIEVSSKVFRNLLEGKGYIVTWVGGKEGGVYIGFKKDQIRKLEYIAREIYGFRG